MPAPPIPAGSPIALAGVGAWGALVLRDLRTLGCEVWAVAHSPESTERARAGGATGIVTAVADLPPVRGAVVCTPIRTHLEVIEALLAAQDVPVAVEKPITADVAEAERLVDRHDGRLFVLDKWRYHPGVEELGHMARSRELGRITSVHLRRVSCGHPVRDVDPVWTPARRPRDRARAARDGAARRARCRRGLPGRPGGDPRDARRTAVGDHRGVERGAGPPA